MEQFNVCDPQEYPQRLSAGESILLREINHRVMNTLAIISLGLEREINGLEGPYGRLLRRYTERICAHAEIYRCLCLREDTSEIAADVYFARLCQCLAEAILDPLGVECVVALDPGFLSPLQCERLGMIVTELVVNSAKHAFKGVKGQVRIVLQRRREEWCCTIEDNGCGFGVPNTGAGNRIVRSLVASIGGSSTAISGLAGTTVTIQMPASSSASSALRYAFQCEA